MSNPFNNDFGNSFGLGGHGELAICVRPHPKYEDGDILVAKNRRAIRWDAAQRICWPRIGNKKAGGMLESTQPLLKKMLEHTSQYKFERVSETEVKRILLSDLSEEIISNTPNGNGEAMDVKQYVARRRAAKKKPIFGTDGAEIWYGGRTTADHATLDLVWNDIETDTPEREINHQFFPFSPRELSGFLVIAVDEFDDTTAGDLTSPLIDDVDPENPVTLKARKNKIIEWRDLRDVSPGNVQNPNLEINIRELRKHVRSTIIETKVP